MYCFSDLLSALPNSSLDKLGDQFTPVSTIEQHVPSLGNILEFGVDDLLAVLCLNLARLDPAR
jgi:hypothetical protein